MIGMETEGDTLLFEWDEKFEWDTEKAYINIVKHHVDFTDAAAVFDDPNRKEWYDVAHSLTEERYVTIGKVRDILFVVYTMRWERIRIISARKATPYERRLYYNDRQI